MKITVFNLCLISCGIAARSTENKILQDHALIRFSNGLIGVASIAGIASRNGRVSSINNFKFYPEEKYRNDQSNRQSYRPVTVSAEKDGKFASGSVQVYPGYVAASATAGFAPQGPLNLRNFNFRQPAHHKPQDFFFHPPEVYAPPNMESLFSNDFFKGIPSSSSDLVRNGWVIPGFNPFVNFWR